MHLKHCKTQPTKIFMKLSISFFVLIFISNLVFAQSPPTYPLPVEFDQNLPTGEFTIDFTKNNAKIYTGGIYLLAKNSFEGFQIKPDLVDGNVVVKQPAIPLNGEMKFIRTAKFNISKSYQIPIADITNVNKVDHILDLHFIPKPFKIETVKSVTNGIESEGKLEVDYSARMRTKLVFEGKNFTRKPTLLFQSNKLIVTSLTANKVEANLDLSLDKVRKLYLGNQKIMIATPFADTVFYPIVVHGKSETTLELKRTNKTVFYEEKESSLTIEFEVINASPTINLFTSCPTEECYIEKLNKEPVDRITDKNSFKIKVPLLLKLPDEVESQKFNIYYTNSDGKKSNTLEININKNPRATAKLFLLDSTKHVLMEGLTSEVKLRAVDNDFSQEIANYSLEIDDTNVPINITSTGNAHTLIATIDMPNSISGVKKKFTLTNGEKQWFGIINEIYNQPSLADTNAYYLPKTEYSLTFDKVNDHAKIVSQSNQIKVIDRLIDDGVGQIRINEFKSDEEYLIKVISKYDTVSVIRLPVKKPLQPKAMVEIKGTELLTHSSVEYLIFNRKNPKINIETKNKYVSSDNSQELKVGIKEIGNDFEKNEKLTFTEFNDVEFSFLNPKGGEKYRISILDEVNNNEDNYYGVFPSSSVKFKFGLTGARFILEDINKDFDKRIQSDSTLVKEQRFQVLEGINAGVFFYPYGKKTKMWKNDLASSKRFLGLGIYFNAIVDSDGFDFGRFIGLGVVLKETIMLGVDLGSQPAISLGIMASIDQLSTTIASLKK